MADNTPALATLASVIQNGIDNRLKDLHTAMPGIVESFNPDEQTISVQPAIRRVFKTVDSESEILVPTELPILINVPVVQPRGGGFSITFPIKRGDECLLVFCERSIDKWQKFGNTQEPGARRFHALSDATAFIGISSLPNVIPDYDPNNVQIKKDNGSVIVTLKADGNLELHADSNITADCVDATLTCSGSATIEAATQVDITAPVINLNGAVNISGLSTMNAGIAVTGGATANGKDFGDTHQHSQGPDSDGDTQANISGVL